MSFVLILMALVVEETLLLLDTELLVTDRALWCLTWTLVNFNYVIQWLAL